MRRTAFGDDGDDLTLALARKVVSGEDAVAESVEQVLAPARAAEAASEELLVDDEWKVIEAEPELVEVRPVGTNGRVALVNGNGHQEEEAVEGQQSLFSWAEFMAEEPVKPKVRKQKPQSATLSMFEWALTVEQEREEEELVGAGR